MLNQPAQPSEDRIESVKECLASMTGALGVNDSSIFFDARRIATTIGYIQHFNLARGPVVEIGSQEYASSRAIWKDFPGASVTGTTNDLRTEPLPFESGSVSSLICLEVIEHLSDVPYHQATTLSGLFFFLNELYRVLSVGGRALITTPNAASLWAIQRALLNQPPLMYEWHFREFTLPEIKEIVESIGFNVVSLSTEYVWHLWDFSPIQDFMRNNGYSAEERGDDIFLVIERPEIRKQRPNNLQLPI